MTRYILKLITGGADLSADPEADKIRALPLVMASNALIVIFGAWTWEGAFFLLFLDRVGLPVEKIGLVLSIFPFCGLVALWFAPVAGRLGRKQVFILGYGIRKFVMAGLLAVPWIAARAGSGAAFAWVVSVVTCFALLRALAETAVTAWNQEIVPDRLRGKFSGLITMLCTATGLAALFTAGRVLDLGEGLAPFLVLIALGCLLGFAGVMFMRGVPGGAPVEGQAGSARRHLGEMLGALSDGNLRAYLGALGLLLFGLMSFSLFPPLFMKEALSMSPGLVVKLAMAGSLGSLLSALTWGRLADRFGSRPVLVSSVFLLMLLPLAWLLLPRETTRLVAWCAVLQFAGGLSGCGYFIGSGRLFYNSVIPTGRSTPYTALTYAWGGLASGLAPLSAGLLLAFSGARSARAGYLFLDGWTVLFALAFLLKLGGWLLFRRTRPDDRYTTRMVLHLLGRAAFRNRLPSRRRKDGRDPGDPGAPGPAPSKKTTSPSTGEGRGGGDRPLTVLVPGNSVSACAFAV